MKKYLILGATGLVGSNFAKYILDNTEDIDVTLLARDSVKLEKLMLYLNYPQRLNILVHDITDDFTIENSFDVILNAASYTSLDEIKNNPLNIINSNTLGVLNSLKFITNSKRKKNTKYIYLSSIAVYGENSNISIDETYGTKFGKTDENSQIYSLSKLLGENLLIQSAKLYNINFMILRISSVYGYSLFKPRTALYTIIEELFLNGDYKLLSNRFLNKDFIYVKDVITAIDTIINSNLDYKIVNISSMGMLDNYTSIPMLINLILKIFRENYKLFHQVAFIDLDNLVIEDTFKLDNSRLIGCGWSLNWKLEDSVKDLIENLMREVNL